MNRRRAATVAGLGMAVASTMLLPAQASEPEHVGSEVGLVGDIAPDVPPWATDPGYPARVVETGQLVADAYADLVLDIAPDVPPWATDPDYPARVVETGQLVAEAYADLLLDIAPDVPPWATDPGYPARVVETGQLVADAYADLVLDIAPDVPPWATDPDYPRKLVEVGKLYAEYAAAQHYGGGTFTGTSTWNDASSSGAEECRPEHAAARGTVSMTADVAFRTDSATFAGPLAIRGTACGATAGWTSARWTASGTDSSGNTIHCPHLGGVARWTTYWSANVVGGCTLNGVALPKVQLVLWGEHAPTGRNSGALAGGLSVNTY